MASFAGIINCGEIPGGFARLTQEVLAWIGSTRLSQEVVNSRMKFANGNGDDNFHWSTCRTDDSMVSFNEYFLVPIRF